jgi:hypothetical protein
VELDGYLREVTARVVSVLGERVVGVWLVGSGALGDLDPRRSDVDVQAVAAEPLDDGDLRRLAGLLEHDALPVPARGLEFVLYSPAGLTAAGGPRYALNLNTGPRMDHRLSLDPGTDPGFWFTVDVSVARQSAVPLLGPPAAQAFPDLPRPLVAAAVLEGLDWYAGEPGLEVQALLGACRSWAWADDGVWRSKADAARWAAGRLPDPGPVLRALRLRDGEPAGPLAAAEVEDVRARARAALRR